MAHILTYNQIDRQQWSELVRTSETGTWFQSPEAYDFFASMPELMEPFVYAAENKDQYPSVMATYAGIQLAKQSGCKRYDMMGAGEPGVPYGVRDFKAEFGGKLVEHGRFLCVCKPMLYRIGKWGVKILKRK